MGNCLTCPRRGNRRRPRRGRERYRMNPNHTVADSSNIHVILNSDSDSDSDSESNTSVLSDPKIYPSEKDAKLDRSYLDYTKTRLELSKTDNCNPELGAALKSLSATLDSNEEFLQGPSGHHDIAPRDVKQDLKESTNADITIEPLKKKIIATRAKCRAIREASIEAECAPTSTKNTEEIKPVETQLSGPSGHHDIAPRDVKQDLKESTNADITIEPLKKKIIATRAKCRAIREASLEAECAPTSSKNTEEIKPVEAQLSVPSTGESKALRDGNLTRDNSCLQTKTSETNARKDKLHKKKSKKPKSQADKYAVDPAVAKSTTDETRDVDTKPGQSTNVAEDQVNIMDKDYPSLHHRQLVDETNAANVRREKRLEKKRSKAQKKAFGSHDVPTANASNTEVKQFDLQLPGPSGLDTAPKDVPCLQKQELEQCSHTDSTTEPLKRKTKRPRRQAIRETSVEADLAPTSTKNTEETKPVETQLSVPYTGESKALRDGNLTRDNSCLQIKTSETNARKEKLHKKKSKKPKSQADKYAVDAAVATSTTDETRDVDTKPGQPTNVAEDQVNIMNKDYPSLHHRELVDETNATNVRREKRLEKKRSKALAQRKAFGSDVPTAKISNTAVKQFDLQLPGPSGLDIAPKDVPCLQKQEREQGTHTDSTTAPLKKKTKRPKRQAVGEASVEADLATTSTKNTEETKPVETQLTGPSTRESKAIRDGKITRDNFCLQNKTSETIAGKEKLHKKKSKKPKSQAVATSTTDEITDIDTKPFDQSTNIAENQDDTMGHPSLHQLELVDEANAANVRRERRLEKKTKRSKALAQRNAIAVDVPTTSSTNTVEEVKQVDLQLSGLFTQEEENLMNDILANEDRPHGSRYRQH